MMPVEASAFAGRVDHLFYLLTGISVVIIALVLTLVVGFCYRYRRGSKARRGPLPRWISREVEIGWTAATLFIALFLFWWASSAETQQWTPPPNALEVHVVAKQWMWKTQHSGGVREINALHVPEGVPVKLIMTSQDVIHSFYVPALRVKQDVLPGRYTQLWFNADRVGKYHLFCAEYCGTDHSRMTGSVVVMMPGDYARWLAAQPQGDDLAAQGAKLFVSMGCSGCHAENARVHAPSLAGIYGTLQPLADGSFVRADEGYLRDSILLPRRQVVAGYDPIMPNFEGIASEDQIVALIAYLKAMPKGRNESQ